MVYGVNCLWGNPPPLPHPLLSSHLQRSRILINASVYQCVRIVRSMWAPHSKQSAAAATNAAPPPCCYIGPCARSPRSPFLFFFAHGNKRWQCWVILFETVQRNDVMSALVAAAAPATMGYNLRIRHTRRWELKLSHFYIKTAQWLSWLSNDN